MHKFLYMPQNLGVTGCVGCGRCVVSCPSNVDLRQVLLAAVGREVVP